MSKLVNVELSKVKSNPHRMEKTYPFKEEKLEVLIKSINEIGLWEGIIARNSDSNYEIAFGHHRIEAARRLKLKKIPLIVKKLTDLEMLQYMGRENLEEYNADFLVMLNAWEAAVRFFAAPDRGKKFQDIEIARILGWIRKDGKSNQTACACAGAYKLLQGGHIKIDSMNGLSVYAVLELVNRANTRIKQIEDIGKKHNRPVKDITQAKKQVAKAVEITAKKIKNKEITQKNIGGEIDVNTYQFAKERKKENPLFSIFVDSLILQINKMLNTDNVSEKLKEIVDSLEQITMEEDKAAVRNIDFSLSELITRSTNWRNKITNKNKKVIDIKQNLLKGA